MTCKGKKKGRYKRYLSVLKRRKNDGNFDSSFGKCRFELAVPSSSTSDLTFLSYFGLVSVWLFFAFWTEMSLDCYEFLAKSVISIWKWCIVFLEKSCWWMFLRNFMCSSSFLCEFCDLIWRFWREKSFCVCAIKVAAAMIDLTSLWLSDSLTRYNAFMTA